MCEASVNNEEYGCALSFKSVPDKYKTEEMCELSVKRYGRNLELVPEEMKTQKICELAVEQNEYALEYVPDDLKTLEMCELALDDKELDDDEIIGILKEVIPVEFHEELADKYDVKLPKKSVDRGDRDGE